MLVDSIYKASSMQFFLFFLEEYISCRLSAELHQKEYSVKDLFLENKDTELDNYIINNKLSSSEIILLILALVPHIKPNFLNTIIAEFLPNGGEFPEFGGVKGKNHRGILPTGETALYILFGNDVEQRQKGYQLFSEESFLFKQGVLFLESLPQGEPKLSGKLCISEEFLNLFIEQKKYKPRQNANFPASLIETSLSWNDLILKPSILNEVKEIETWLQCNDILLNEWGMKNKIKPGYRVLFHGPPGTGKTLTASLLGKYTKKDVYRIDLSMVVSKYIGETEKNLASLFDKAANKDWILFFDEADSIFGKRTNVRDAHDKYANQEVSYLLQRIENHPGLVILATNLKNNIDTAFTRRFNSLIEFETPSYRERLLLWQKHLPKQVSLEDTIKIDVIAKQFNLTGANIVNIIQYACLKTISEKHHSIQKSVLLEGIKREYAKEERTVSVENI